MPKLFEDSESAVNLKTDNEYAKNYDTWRKKEELNKLKTKYGDVDLSDNSSSSSEDDEVGIEITEETEKDFYKTLALLKKKDPKIYDNDAVFFNESTLGDRKVQKKTKEESMTLKDYERKLLLEKGGIISDSDNEEKIDEQDRNPTIVEEQQILKENLIKAAKEQGLDNEDWDGVYKIRQESREVKEKQEADYKAWLAGQQDKLDDKETELSLKPLKEFWGDPNLEDGEKFLRDYILNKRYLEEENEGYIPTYDEIVHDSDENLSEDENAIKKQEEFEYKFNFRFEEPDQEFIKRYPRTLEGTLRKEDNRRKIKRVEVKERKAKEKAEKMEELRKLRDLKRKEIEEKIQKLKEITGNKEMAFNDEDIDADFDPELHDKRMQALFDESYYDGAEGDQKPKFDSDDEFAYELETENFDNWTGRDAAEKIMAEYGPHCEDEDFNMDADYDPKAATQKELLDNTKKRKKRRRKSKFLEVLSQDRPEFDPTNDTYEKYIDEYYKLDCEDIIDNIPCRFKYRKVPPNSFGLSIDEILLANDRELNKWCSLKKAVQIRPDHVEKYDQIAFSKKGENVSLKMKLLPSLFITEEEEKEKQKKKDTSKNIVKNEIDEEVENNEAHKQTEDNDQKKNQNLENKKKKKKKLKKNSTENEVSDSVVIENSSERNEITEKETLKSGRDKRKHSLDDDETTKDILEDCKTSKKSKKCKPELETNESADKELKANTVQDKPKPKKKRKKKKKLNTNPKENKEDEKEQKSKKRKHSGSMDQQVPRKKSKKNKDVNIGLSNARLAAYGINPKKFKNKLIYGNKKNRE